jgi:kynurenine formamidase
MTQVLTKLIEDLDAGRLRVVDLTQPLGPQTPVIDLPPPFASAPSFAMEVISRYDHQGRAWYWNMLHFSEHTGTHFDAPIHWITGMNLPDNRCDTIPVRRCIGPACVIDTVAEVAKDPDFLLTAGHVLAWEAAHGRIPAGSWVMMRTDWSKRSDAASFLNVAKDGAHSPGFHASAAALLCQRDVLGVGVETIGTDAGQAFFFDPPFPVHAIMHGAGKFGLASLCNLDQVPPTGAVVIAAPLKIVGGSGSPLRVVAISPS